MERSLSLYDPRARTHTHIFAHALGGTFVVEEQFLRGRWPVAVVLVQIHTNFRIFFGGRVHHRFNY
jgi:hypothetical protein